MVSASAPHCLEDTPLIRILYFCPNGYHHKSGDATSYSGTLALRKQENGALVPFLKLFPKLCGKPSTVS